jgi:NAD(P)-dependent dehydrogenase (short-subunit alcohol dehydrogenase family)
MSKVLIVGGTSGIGLATAQLFNKLHDVTVAGLTAGNVKLDFTNEGDVKAFFEANVDFDYVIITATTPLAMGGFLTLDLDSAKKGFDKFWGMTHIVRYAALYSRHLQSISVVSGAAADKRGAPATFLAVTSSSINLLVESLAIELAPMRINAISPGVTMTPLYGDTPKHTLQEWADASPLKRLASAAEVAEVIHFVTLHPQMTGSVIPVDGGARLV